MSKISPRKLYLIVFTTGAIVMVLELIGSRILAPTLGTSIFVWTSLIGIILGAMSLGYYLGGKLADKNPSLRVFSTIIFVAGISVFLIIITKNPILTLSAFWGIKGGSIFASITLFVIPAMLLGSVSPYAVRLAMKNVESSGNTVGNLYAVSTGGSIMGTFLAGFYLIPTFGSTNILYGLAIMLFLASLFVYGKKSEILKTAITLLFFLGVSISSNAAHKDNFLVDEDSAYNHIRVYDRENKDGQMIRVMSVENFFDSGMFLDSDELVFKYSEYFRLDNVFGKNIKKAAIFGGAAYSIPKDFVKRNEEGEIDVVEIDPRTTEIAREYFRLGESERTGRINIYHQDARIFLNDAEKTKTNKYDAVYNDAFSSMCSTPFHLTTEEAIEKTYNILDDDGIYIINLISAISGSKSEFFRAEYKTIKQKFQNVYVFPVLAQNETSAENVQNIVIIATKQEVDIENFLKNHTEEKTNELLSHLWKYDIQTDDVKTLTDDFAPVSFYALKLCLSD